MGFKTKIQLIRRKNGHEQWYINFPSACAQMLDFRKGEMVEWVIKRSGELALKLEGKNGKKRS